MTALRLVRPRFGLRDGWTDAHREWGPGLHEDGFGIGPQDDVDTEDGFRAWVGALRHDPADTWWIVEGDIVLGGIALRHGDDQDARIRRHGHLGYGIRPSARGRGIAAWAVRQVLVHAAAIGIDPVIAVCRDDNAGSVAVLEGFTSEWTDTEQHGDVRVRRFALRATGTSPLRPVTPADIPELRAFLQAADLTLAGLDAPQVHLWVERGDDGMVTGSTGFESSSDGADVLIRSVAVAQSLRGTGSGSRLARFALDRAAENSAAQRGAERAWLFSRRSGPFWEQLGFSRAGRQQLATVLADTTQVTLFTESGQLEHEVAWSRAL